MKKHFLNQLKSKKGFTLIELIVVVAIVAVLAAVGIPALAGQMSKSVKATADSNAKLIATQGDIMITEASATVDYKTPKGNSIASATITQNDALVKEILEACSISLKNGESCSVTISDVYDTLDPTRKVGHMITKVEFIKGSTTGTFTRT